MLVRPGSCRQHNCRAVCPPSGLSLHDMTVSAVQVSSANLQQPAHSEAQASQQPGPSCPPTQPSDSGPAAPSSTTPAGVSQERRSSEQAAAAEAALSAGPGPAGPRRRAAADDSLQHPGGRHLRATLQRPSARMLFALTSRKDRHQPVLTSWEEAIAQVRSLPLEPLRCRPPDGRGACTVHCQAHAEETHYLPGAPPTTGAACCMPAHRQQPAQSQEACRPLPSCAASCGSPRAAGCLVRTDAHWRTSVPFSLAQAKMVLLKLNSAQMRPADALHFSLYACTVSALAP